MAAIRFNSKKTAVAVKSLVSGTNGGLPACRLCRDELC